MHRRGLRRELGGRVHSTEEVSNLLLSRQCMRYRVGRYRFNPFAKDLGQSCRRYRVVT